MQITAHIKNDAKYSASVKKTMQIQRVSKKTMQNDRASMFHHFLQFYTNTRIWHRFLLKDSYIASFLQVTKYSAS
jgi:hypothetical protein